MLFQLDDLGLSPASFRLLYAIIRRSYHTKFMETTIPELCMISGLTRNKAKLALDDLKERGLIFIVQNKRFVYEITLAPKIIKIMNLDYKRKGAKSQPKAKPEPKVKSQPKAKPEPKAKSEPKIKAQPKKRTEPTLKKNEKNVRYEYCTTNNEPYYYFIVWLQKNEAVRQEDVPCLTKEFLQQKWDSLKKYAPKWLSMREQGYIHCSDIGYIRFMKKVAKLTEEKREDEQPI